MIIVAYLPVAAVGWFEFGFGLYVFACCCFGLHLCLFVSFACAFLLCFACICAFGLGD